MMKNKILLYGIIFGLILALSFIIINSILANEINLKIIVSAIIGSATGGLVYALLMKYILNTAKKLQIEVEENENILKEAPANHIQKMESVGGKLFLTTKKLVFKSHKLNIQKHLFQLDLENLIDCQEYKTMGTFSNGLKITTNQNKTEKFVVNKPNEWIEKIKENT